MSARRSLLEALAADLDPATFIVSDRAAVPDQIDPDLLGVRAFTNTVVPGPSLGLLTYTLELWVMSPSQDVEAVDDRLDDALDEVLGALLALRSVSFGQAERSRMGSEDGPQYHGYKITLTAYATTNEGA